VPAELPAEMPAELRRLAESTTGFMPPDEGLALFAAAAGAPAGPVVELGTYCAKSTVYLAAGARLGGRVVVSVDHHRGSEENQAGWTHHDPSLVDPTTGRMDTLPRARATLERGALEGDVVLVVGRSTQVAALMPAGGIALLFIDGGHSEAEAQGDYAAWAHRLRPGGLLAIHDVFPDPADGGQAPFHVWQRARNDGFEPVEVTGSLRILRRPGR
jgi:predicted O-methyltransferase YrrM